MATLSTLELMLRDLQQNQENLETYNDHATLPVLPQRPVSKARIPSRRTRRAILSFHAQEFGGKKEEFVDSNSKNKRDGLAIVNGGLVFHQNEMKNDGEAKAEKGIIGIQKCFRGYKARFHYHKLKEGIIFLQSFIRGENVRREFQNSIRKFTRTHNIQEFVWKPLRDRETTILYLQSVVRDWLSRKHLDYIENATIENTKEIDDIHNENLESEEHVTVSESYIRELERQVLRTEAALRHKICENANLELQIQQIDTRWKLHNATMNSKEKTWQDELTSIQMSLASARERITEEITYLPRNPTRHEEDGKINLTIKQILELQESDPNLDMDNLNLRKFHEQELKKLKVRFKAWKKEFKARIHNLKRILNRFDDQSRTEKVYKTCFLS